MDDLDTVRKALKRACLSEHGLVQNTGFPYTKLRPLLKHLIEKGEVERDGHRYAYKGKTYDGQWGQSPRKYRE